MGSTHRAAKQKYRAVTRDHAGGHGREGGSTGLRMKSNVIIVMPAFNAASTLEQTVRDIPAEFADEIILVDDASTDDTLRIARGSRADRCRARGKQGLRRQSEDLL